MQQKILECGIGICYFFRYDAIEVPFDLGNQEMHSMEEKQVIYF